MGLNSDDPSGAGNCRLIGVLVTYHRVSELRASLGALRRQRRPLDRLVVVNNGTPGDLDQLADELRFAATDGADVIDTGDNLGPAGGIAVGMRRALESASDDDALVLLDDDDPLPDDAVLHELVVALTVGRRERPTLAGVALRGARLDRRTGVLHGARPVEGEATDVDYLKSGWAATYSVAAVRQVDVFDASLFFGFDDLEYGLRLRDAGFVLEVHDGRRDAPAESPPPAAAYRRSPWRTYYTTRNLVVIYRRYGLRSAAARTGFVQGVAKPVANLLRRPRNARVQAHMAIAGLTHALRGRMGRRVEPTEAKT